MVLKDIIDNNGNVVVDKGSVLGSFRKLLIDQMMAMLKIASDYLDDGYIGIKQVFGNNDAITVLNSTLSSIKRTLYLNQAKLDVVLEVKDGINTSSQESKQQILKGA